MNKKILLAVFIVVVAIAAVFVVATKNRPVAHEPEKSNEITNVPEPTVVPEVTEEPTEPVTAPADESLFGGEVTGSTPESIVDDEVRDTDSAMDAIVMADPTVVAWNKPIEYAITSSTEYPDTNSTSIYISINNTDCVCCLMETDSNYESLGVSNVYGSDYACIYWNNGTPEYSKDIYDMLYNNQLSTTYIGDTSQDDVVTLTNCSTGESISICKQDDVWVLSESGDSNE